jgi:hypothetical protein
VRSRHRARGAVDEVCHRLVLQSGARLISALRAHLTCTTPVKLRIPKQARQCQLHANAQYFLNFLSPTVRRCPLRARANRHSRPRLWSRHAPRFVSVAQLQILKHGRCGRPPATHQSGVIDRSTPGAGHLRNRWKLASDGDTLSQSHRRRAGERSLLKQCADAGERF